MEKNKINPEDAIIAAEGADGTYIAKIDALLRSGKVRGWLQIVVLVMKDNRMHVFPQGYDISEYDARQTVRMGLDTLYAKEQ